MANTFSGSLDSWTVKTEQRLEAVHRESAVATDRELATPKSEGGNLPYVTGRLRRSRAASTIGPPPVLWRQEDFSGTDAGVEAVIRSATAGQTIWIGFQAPYAKKAEEKHAFVRLTAQRFPQIVEETVQRLKAAEGE